MKTTVYLSPINSNNIDYYVNLFINAGFETADKANVIIAKPYYKFSDRNPFGIEKTLEILEEVNKLMFKNNWIKTPFTVLTVDEPKTHEVSQWRDQISMFSEDVIYFTCPIDYEIYSRIYSAKFIETGFPRIVEPNYSGFEPMLAGYLQGCLYADSKTYATAIPTVDVALIVKNDKKQSCLVLGKKRNDDRLHFPGGFVDSSDESYEHAASRELCEEVSLNLLPESFEYIGSERIMDWRYSKLKHKIITHLYLYDFTDPSNLDINDFALRQLNAADDLESLEIIPLHEINESNLTDHHQGLFHKVKKYYSNKYEI